MSRFFRCEIINEVKERMPSGFRVNDRIIYYAQIEGEVIKRRLNKKKTKYNYTRKKFKIMDVYSPSSGQNEHNIFLSNIIKITEMQSDIPEDSSVDVQKIILKKELGCAIY